MAELAPLIDLSYILEISGNDTSYIGEVIGIFLDTMGSGLPLLSQLVIETTDYEKIHKQAHFLKSSAGIIKVRNNYDNLVKINALSLAKSDLDIIKELVAELLVNFEEARPELERMRNEGM